jgi:hypothetical protein
MNRQELYNWFEEHMGFVDNPKFASYPPERQAIKVAAQFFSAVDRFYDSALTPDPSDDTALVNVLQSLYDKYFVPIDLPMNNMLEKMVEGYGRSFIDLGVSGLANAIQKRNAA